MHTWAADGHDDNSTSPQRGCPTVIRGTPVRSSGQHQAARRMILVGIGLAPWRTTGLRIRSETGVSTFGQSRLHRADGGSDKMRKCRWAVATVAALVLCVSVLATGTVSASTTTTEAMVRGKLLSLSNLPAGWTLTNVPATNKGYSGPCAAALSPKPRPGLAEAYVAFTDRGRSPLLGEKVVFGKAVTNRYNYVNAVLKSCKYLTFALGGIDEKGTVDPLSFPKLGSSSSAYTITVPTTLGVSVGIDIVISGVARTRS